MRPATATFPHRYWVVRLPTFSLPLILTPSRERLLRECLNPLTIISILTATSGAAVQKSFQMSILWAASIMLPWFQQMQAAYVSTTRKLSVKTVCPILLSSLPRATGTGILSRICAWNLPIPKTKSTVLTAGGLR